MCPVFFREIIAGMCQVYSPVKLFCSSRQHIRRSVVVLLFVFLERNFFTLHSITADVFTSRFG